MIKVEVRFKNGNFLNALKRKGLNIPKLSKITGINITTLYNIAQLKRFPQSQILRDRISFALETSDELLFDYYKDLNLKDNKALSFEVLKESLISLENNKHEILQIPDNFEFPINKESFRKDLDRTLETLPKRDAEIFKKYFLEDKTILELSEEYKLTRERIRTIIEKSKRSIRLSSAGRHIKQYLG